jgi:hypothetical protein
MSVFALDQAITAAMVALAHAPDSRISAAASGIVRDERVHQQFAMETFQALANRDSALGRRLAHEMIEARDWVRQIFPRREALGKLAEQGVLTAEALRAHDTFLASLGDSVQDALGVLGEL